MESNILDRYEQAQRLNQGQLTNSLVLNDAMYPHWIENSPSFLYVRQTKSGREFRLVNADTASNELAFDHKLLASELTKNTDKVVSYQDLPLKNVTLTLSPLKVYFEAFNKHWVFDVEIAKCQEIKQVQQGFLHSPDGKKTVFVRDHNIWVQDKAEGEEQALTQDGNSVCSYARSTPQDVDPSIQARWSPDSSKLFTVQLDIRGVRGVQAPNYLPKPPVEVNLPPCPRPFDEHVESYHLIIIDVTTGQIMTVDYPPLPWVIINDAMLGFFSSKMGVVVEQQSACVFC